MFIKADAFTDCPTTKYPVLFLIESFSTLTVKALLTLKPRTPVTRCDVVYDDCAKHKPRAPHPINSTGYSKDNDYPNHV